jgi:hypothetical protein
MRHFVRIIRNQSRRSKLVLIGIALTAVLVLAPSSDSQILPSPCCAILSAGLGSIASAITSVIGGGLNTISSVLTSIETFERDIVWPQDLINEARAVVGNVRGLFNQVQRVAQIDVSSATLPRPRELEQTLLSADSGVINAVGSQYGAIYSAVPPPTDASPEVRNVMDMTDATAEAAMKRAIEIDAIADLEVQAADQMIQEVQNAAPGSAPILEAGAAAWLVRSNAYTQAALTDLMRLRAIDLATAGAEMKLDTQRGTKLRGNVTDALKRN